MPRRHSDTGVVHFGHLRHYLHFGTPTSGADILDDVFVSHEPGARQLLQFCLQLRGNVRTRTTVDSVRQQWRRVAAGQPSPRDYIAVERHLWGMYTQFRKYGFPRAPQLPLSRLAAQLPRTTQRALSYTGTTVANLPTLAERARTAGVELKEEMRNQQLVVWMDNWYCERYGVNPEQPNASTDVTACAVLILSSADDGPSAHTRSHTLPIQDVNQHIETREMDCLVSIH